VNKQTKSLNTSSC